MELFGLGLADAWGRELAAGEALPAFWVLVQVHGTDGEGV
jgi:hypothetical protein